LAHKLDIFDTLAALDRRDFDFLDRQADDVKKGFAPPVVMRWMSASQDRTTAAATLMLVNEIANRNFYDIYDHPELQFKLLASCGLGRTQRHAWVPLSKQTKEGGKLYDYLGKHWPEASHKELKLVLSQFTRDTFAAFLEDSGCDPADIKGLVDAYDRFYGIEPPKKAKGRRKG
jgi:hypothetical protein